MLVTPLAKSKIVIPIIAYHKVCRAVVTLVALPPLVIKTIAAQRIMIVEITNPISKSQVAILSINCGMVLAPEPRGLGSGVVCATTIFAIIIENRKRIKKVFIFKLYT